MDNQDKVRWADTTAHVLRIAGVLFFIAMAFQIITWKYAMFGGVACFIVAPALRKIVSGQ